MNRGLGWILLAVTALALVPGAVSADEPPPRVTGCELCLRSPVEADSGYVCEDPGSVITTTTEEIYLMFELECPIYEAHELSSKWYAPVYGLFTKYDWTLSAPSTAGYGWWNWYVDWTWLDVAGAGPDLHPGTWRVELYVDDQFACSREFEIELSTAAREAVQRGVRDALRVDPPTDGSDVTIHISVGSEAAGFPCRILYSTGLEGGTYEGEAIELGPDAKVLDVESRLDEEGEATIVVPWFGEESEYYFQVIVAVNEASLEEGNFWQSEPIEHVHRSNGIDPPHGGSGDDKLLGCAADSPYILDECLRVQFGPDSLRSAPEDGVTSIFSMDGHSTYRSVDGTSVTGICYLPVDLPAVSCCQELQLRELRICYQCLTANDSITGVRIGYLNDEGEFTALTEVKHSLESLSWDCVSIVLSVDVVPRPMVLQFRLAIGGGAAGGVRFGNMAMMLAPASSVVSPLGIPRGQGPVGVPCASACVGPLENVFASPEQYIHCANGFNLSRVTSEYEVPPPSVLLVALINNCGYDINCTEWMIYDSKANLVARGSGDIALGEKLGSPQEIGRWSVGDTPEGTYILVAETDIGQLRAAIRIVRDTPG